MKKYIVPLLTIIATITILTLQSCRKSRTYLGRTHSVVVIHSWADKGEEGEPFRKMMMESFKAHGTQAKIHHVYLDMIRNLPQDIDHHYWPSILDSINKWQPEIILINDDPAFNWMLEGKHDEVFRKLPVIFAGITCLDTKCLQNYMNITGFEDVIDLKANLDMIRNLTSETTTIIDLDNFKQDNILHKKLLTQIYNSKNIIDNSDFHLKKFNKEYIDSIAPGKKCVIIASCQDPSRGINDSKKQKNIDAMKDIMVNAKDHTFLQVKYDIYSNTLQDRSGRPMFTCIREQFNNPNDIHVIGGYFTDTETQVDEQVQYAVGILEEHMDPCVMPVSSHDKKYLIDYNAMRNMSLGTKKGVNTSGLKELVIDDWGNQYNIINTPLYLKNRKYWIGGVIVSAIILIFVISISSSVIRKRLKKYREQLMQDLENALNLRRHILSEADSSVWRIYHKSIEFPHDFAKQHGIKTTMRIKDFENYIHSDSLNEWEKIKDYRTDLGRRKIRLKIAFNQKDSWHWYDMIYNVTTEASYKWELRGLIVSTDDDVSRMLGLEIAVKEAKEIDLKEKFLINFQQTLNEPLQIILRNARSIIIPEVGTTEAEMAEYSEQLHKGAENFIRNIDILVKSNKDNSGSEAEAKSETAVETETTTI